MLVNTLSVSNSFFQTLPKKTFGCRPLVWLIRKQWPRSEAVTRIINIYIGVGVNIVGSTR